MGRREDTLRIRIWRAIKLRPGRQGLSKTFLRLQGNRLMKPFGIDGCSIIEILGGETGNEGV